MLCIVCVAEIMYLARTRIFDFASEGVATYVTVIFKYPRVLIDNRILFFVQSLAITSEIKLSIYFVNPWLNRFQLSVTPLFISLLDVFGFSGLVASFCMRQQRANY
jgi:hypothetical protein